MGAAATRGAATLGAVPIVEFPSDDEEGDGEQHVSYDYIPRMQVLIGRLAFSGKNGFQRNASAYSVIFDTGDYNKVPTHSDFDIYYRVQSTDYITQLTEEEAEENARFVMAMGANLLTCQFCVGPRGGTATLAFRKSGSCNSEWHQSAMPHVAQLRRHLAAHNYFLSCKKDKCNCRISFRGVVKIVDLIHGHMSRIAHRNRTLEQNDITMLL